MGQGLKPCRHVSRAVPHLGQQAGVVPSHALQMGMSTSGGAGEFQQDGQRPAHQRLGLRQPVRGLEQLRQVVEAVATSGCSGP